ncbi:MAG: KH domain-containing protein [Patescibacteria group bacterium]|uniref:RNA-binding protein KhpA n=1 Tax=candidate division WWE3 bacterium TaxID=2053526 RepID=A0A955J2E6_UNCKA|nr:KH domain-containing protein [candidate division WWE3 bacterium]
MLEYVTYIIKQIVESPDAVKVEESVQDFGTLYTIHVKQSDMGRVIGKEGNTIKSIRALAKAKAIKDNLRIRIDLFDPERDSE